jgi:glutathione synthase/RimK-type ligase-like ATP-grasp enzyme
LNPARALLATHDKLRTAVHLEAAGVAHPRRVHLPAAAPLLLSPPVVLKPRFGSWGKDPRLCQTRRDLEQALREIRTRPWFRRQRVLAQEVIPSSGSDLRVLVARGASSVPSSGGPHPASAGQTSPSAAANAWPTHSGGVLTGDHRRGAVGADLVGVDLLPLPGGPGGRHVVLELNGAADFDGDYSQPGGDVFADAARALGLLTSARAAVGAAR